MSNSIDERIVQMQFDNKKFEDGVAESLKTLDKLKNATDFKASVKSFTDLESAAKTLSFGNLEAGVKSLTDRFSTLGIVGMTALQNITNKAVDAGERLVKSLTIDQVTTGWDKYADKTSAVQTIMAATAKDFDDTGKQMEYVNDQLDKLNWFTDETSYHFLDMVSNIGKFTSKGIDLETSVTAMQGIANWAAISGANANDATRAMNNLSQALGMGAVKVQDWQSIESVNMDTFEFKNIVLETAVALGTLEKTADGAYKTIGKKGKEVTNATFRNTLAEGWFTSDVLIKSLDQYGAFTDKLYEATEKTGATATEFLGWIEDYQNGTIDLTKIAKNTRTSVEDLDVMLSELSSDTYDLGRRSLQAGQEAKTFGEAIGSVKEAVSTGWMNTFELIFGDYMEAKELWTDLSEGLWNVFAKGGEERNELLEGWRAIERVVEDTGKGLIVYEDGAKAIGILGAEVQTLDGRTFLIEGVTSALQALVNVGSAVKYAFQSIFPPITASRLFDLTVGFRDFTSRIKDALYFVHEFTTEEERDGDQVTRLHDEITEMSKPIDILVRTLKGVFAAGKIVVDTFKAIGKAVWNALGSNMSLFGSIGEFIASIGDKIVAFKDNLKETDWYNTSLGTMSSIFTTIGSAVHGALSRLKQFGTFLYDKFAESGIGEKIQKQFSKLGSYISEHLPGVVDKIGEFFSGILDWVEQSGIVQKGIQKLGKGFKWLSGVAVDAWNWGKEFFTNLWDYVKSNEQIQEWFSSASETVRHFGTVISDFVKKVASAISKFFKRENVNGEDVLENLRDQLSPFEKISGWFKDIFENMKTNWSNISDWFTDISSRIHTAFSNFFGTVGGAFEGFKDKAGNLNLGSIFWGIVKGLGAIAGIKFLHNFSNIGKNLEKGLKSIGNGLKLFGKGEIQKKESIGTTFLKIAGSIAIVAAAVGILTTIDPERLQASFDVVKTLALGMSGLMVVLGIVNKLAKNSLSKVGTSFLKISGGLLSLVGAIWILEKIEMDDFIDGLGKLVGILTALMIFEIGVRKFGGKGSSGTDFIKLGIGVLALVASLKWLSSSSIPELAKGAGALVVVLGSLVGALYFLNKNEFTKGGTGKIIVFAATIMVLAGTFKSLAKLSDGQTIKGVVAFGTIVGSVIAIMTAISFASKNKTSVEGLKNVVLTLGTLIAAMSIMILGLKQLEGYNGPDILRTMTGLSEFALAIGAVTAGMGFAVSKLKFGNVFLGGLALALSEFTQVALAGIVGWIDEASSGNFGNNITRGVELIEKTSEALNSFVLGAGGLLLIGSAGAGAIFASDPLIGVATFLAGLVADLLILGSVVTVDLAGVINDYFTGDDNISMIDKGAEVLGKTAEALKTFIGASDIDNPYEGWSYAGTALAVLVGSVLDLATQLVADVGALIGTTVLGLIGSSENWTNKIERGRGAVVLIGESIGGFAGAIAGAYKGKTLESFSEHLPAFGDNLTAFTDGLKPFDQDLVDRAATIGTVFSELEKSLAPQNGVWQFLTGEQNLGDFGTRLGEFGTGLATFGTSLDPDNITNVETMVKLTRDLISIANESEDVGFGSLWGIALALEGIAGQAFSSFVAPFSDPDGEMTNHGKNVISNFIGGIKSKDSEIRSVGVSIIVATSNSIVPVISRMRLIGDNAITGYLNGLSSKINQVRNAAASIGNTTVSSLKASLNEHSPSVEAYEAGDYFIIGYINSLHDSLSKVANASENIGNQTILSLSETLGDLSSLIGGDIDLQPTITPVFDMSNLGEASDQLDNAFYMTKHLNLAQSGAFSRNVEAVSDLNFKMGSTLSNAGVIDAINDLGGRVDALSDAMANMKLVLDTGATVGGLASSMDRALGQRATNKGRGN